jgi:hypothetical protein
MAIKMGFIKRRCQAEEACVTTGRKSTDPVFRYQSVARFGRIDRSRLLPIDSARERRAPSWMEERARTAGAEIVEGSTLSRRSKPALIL